MALLGITLLKLARRPASWVILLVALGLIAIFFLALGASASQVASTGEELQIRLMLGFPTAYIFLVAMILSIGGLLSVVYGAAIIGSEWSAGTVRSIVARGESRIRFTIVTFLAIALALLVGLVILFVLGIGLAVVGAQLAGFGTAGATDEATLLRFPDLIARSWLGVITHAAIGFTIAMLFKSQLAGIAAGLGLYFGAIFLGLVPFMADIVPYLPFSVANAVVAPIEGLDDGGFGTATTLEPDTAVIIAGLYIVIALAAASWSAWRAQITQ